MLPHTKGNVNLIELVLSIINKRTTESNRKKNKAITLSNSLEGGRCDLDLPNYIIWNAQLSTKICKINT